jgi:hypothetical protein
MNSRIESLSINSEFMDKEKKIRELERARSNISENKNKKVSCVEIGHFLGRPVLRIRERDFNRMTATAGVAVVQNFCKMNLPGVLLAAGGAIIGNQASSLFEVVEVEEEEED